MGLRVSGLRLGIQISTSRGFVPNGEIPAACRDEIERAGYRLEECPGVPPTKPNPEELAAMMEMEADKVKTAHEMAVSMTKMLGPLRKRFYGNTDWGRRD